MDKELRAEKRHIRRVALLDDRAKDYEKVIREALDKGYRVCGIEEFYHNRQLVPEQRFMVLRHDVDALTGATRKMFMLERRLGVLSTYYFRNGTLDVRLAREMHEAGYEVGFHYETLVDMYKEHQFTCGDDLDMESARARFVRDLAAFEEKVGFKTVSCSAHGHTINRNLGISSRVIFEGVNAGEMGVEFEAYTREIYDTCVDFHLIDCSIVHNGGYSYKGKTPENGLALDKNVILFVTHPHNWYSTTRRYLYQLAMVALGKNTLQAQMK